MKTIYDNSAIGKEVHQYALLSVESPNVWVEFSFVKMTMDEHKRVYFDFYCRNESQEKSTISKPKARWTQLSGFVSLEFPRCVRLIAGA